MLRDPRDLCRPGAAFTLSRGRPWRSRQGGFRDPDQITIGAGTVSGDSRAERLKFKSQAKFFNPFNRVRQAPGADPR